MNNIKEYYEEIDHAIDDADTIADLTALAIQCNDIVKNVRNVRMYAGAIPFDMSGFKMAFDNDLEHYEGKFDLLEKRALGFINDKEQEAIDEANHGSYDDQVRSEYNGNRL